MSIIERLLLDLRADAAVRKVLVGASWTAAVLDTDPPCCGLASTLRAESHSDGPPVRNPGQLAGQSGRALAELLRSPRTLEASIGMATYNALLEVDESVCLERNAADLILEQGVGRSVAVEGWTQCLGRKWWMWTR